MQDTELLYLAFDFRSDFSIPLTSLLGRGLSLYQRLLQKLDMFWERWSWPRSVSLGKACAALYFLLIIHILVLGSSTVWKLFVTKFTHIFSYISATFVVEAMSNANAVLKAKKFDSTLEDDNVGLQASVQNSK